MAVIKKCRLDKDIKGYDLFYAFSRISLFILILLSILLVWILLKYILRVY